MSTPVEVHHDPPPRFNLDGSRSLHELAINPFGFGMPKAIQLVGQPTVTAVGQYRQDRVQVYVQSDFAGQAVQVEEIDAAPQPVFHSVAPGIIRNQFAWTDLEVVGQEECRLFSSQP